MLSGSPCRLLPQHSTRGSAAASRAAVARRSLVGVTLKSPREPLHFVWRSEKVVPDPADSLSIQHESWEPVSVNQSVPFS